MRRDPEAMLRYSRKTSQYSNRRSRATVRREKRPGLGFLLAASALLFFGAAADAQIAFDQKTLDFNGNGSISNSTAIQFGPDGRLYVSERFGLVKVFTVTRDESTGNYLVTDAETISLVQDIPNHNDDGSDAESTNTRQVTGLVVGGTAGAVELYVSSSDSRVGAGGGGGDINLDTNSGVITRLTPNGSGWDAVDIVRGLPRSEENHAPNGLELVQITSLDENGDSVGDRVLLLSSGGFTNAGSPSNNFAFITEYALSGAVLSINLDMLEDLPIQTDSSSGRSYIYDLPTLDDPTRNNVNGIADPNDPGYDGIDVDDPWGGNDGLNQAKVVPGGPVQIFSPGYRNTYDLVVTESGRVYVTDNGANGGWGGYPENEATGLGGGTSTVTNNYRGPDEPGSDSFDTANNEPQVNNEDHLNLVTTDIQSYSFGSAYGGHPAPVRANVDAGLYTLGTHTNDPSDADGDGNTDGYFRTVPYDPNGTGDAADPGLALPADWPPVPLSEVDPANSDFRMPGENNPDSGNSTFEPFVDPLDDITVTTWSNNTNGITEYTASNFSGAMQGNLLAGKSGGDVHRVELDTNGQLANLTQSFFSGLGGNPLGLTAQGDSDIFPGTIWVATFNSAIVILEPNDFVICVLPGDPGYDPNADNDFDGYTNQDEIDNGTDLCSGASQPPDFDDDKVSNLNDTDDDGDGIDDALDPAQLGTPIDLPYLNELFSDQLDESGNQIGYLGLGLTGLMNNGAPNPNWLNWIDRTDQGTGPNDILGGAIGAVTIQQTGGTAAGATNTQEKAYQTAYNVSTASGPFTVESRMSQFNGLYNFTVGDFPPSQGIQIGTGFQDNYIELVLTQAGFTFREEVNDATAEQIDVAIATGDRPGGSDPEVILYLNVDPSAGSVEAQYSIDGGPITTIGTISAEGATLDAIQQSATPFVAGLIGTSGAPEDLADPNDDREFAANWDTLFVSGSAPFVSAPLPDVEAFVDDPADTFDLDNFFDDNNGTANLTYTVETNTDPTIGASIAGSILTLTYPSSPASTSITVRATDSDAFFAEQSFTVTVTDEPVVLVRINAGGAEVDPMDGSPVWVANSGGGSVTGTGYTVNTGNIATHNIPASTGRHPSIPPEISDAVFNALFADERWDPASAPEMLWSIPISNGTYTVRLYMGNGFGGTSEPGERIFDVNIEGGPLEIDGLDLSATYGDQVGAMQSYVVQVLDEELNIEFFHDVENPLINAIEILGTPGASIPISVDPIPAQTSVEGFSVSLQVTAGGGDGALTYSATGLPTGLSINSSTGLISGTIATGAAANSPYNVEVTVDDADGESTDAETVSFTWDVNVAPEPGAVIFRVNTGGNVVSDTDLDWSEDRSAADANGTATIGTPSPYLFQNTNTDDVTFGATLQNPNATSAPDAVFNTERYSTVAGTANNMKYDFPVPSGDYLVNLYFAETWTGAQNVGDRIFDVLIEDTLVLDNLDQTAKYGWNTAAVESFAVTVTDDNIDIDFVQVMQNPAIKAIEIRQADAPANPDAAAVVAIDTGTGINSSTFNGGFGITNNSTNGLQITQVSFDLSTAIFPEMVFDPNGTAGDSTALCLQSQSGAADTGLVTPTDPCSDPFSSPRGNGGFDVITVSFTDFDPGETYEFAVDVDPTSIEGEPTSGGAGSVSGLELAGSNVAVTFSDGTTVLQGEPFRIPASDGGSQVTLLPAAAELPPTVTIPGAVLADSSPAGAQNATVGSLTPTVQLDGPAGAAVSLLIVQADRTVPITDPFEANAALAVTQIDDVIGATGTVDIPVSLTDGGPDELNYIAAVIQQADGRTTRLSTVWRVDYNPTAPGTVLFRVNTGGPQVAAADASTPDWGADTDAAPSPYRLANGGGAGTFSATAGPAHPGAIDMSSSTLPPSAPVDIFEIERWDAPEAPEMLWEFPVTAGTDVIVRLYFAELFGDVTAAGQRVFDVAIEGTVPPAFDDIDQFAIAGAKGAFMLQASTTVSADGVLNVDFLHDVIENPAIKGIEIVAGSLGTPEAMIQVNPGGGLAASTFGGGSFVLMNLGDVDIVSVTINSSTAYLPDVVFDPVGTAGDSGAKCLTPDSGATETGFIAPSDPCVDPFSLPHNGVDNADGYDALTIEFDDFNNGETFTFSTDMDPTSIKNDTTTGDAGAISGFELIGSTVTIEFESGAILTTNLFDESSLGGSMALAEQDMPAPPTLSLVGATAPIALPDANQSILVTGTPGAMVTLLQVDARLYIDSGGGGYDIDPFEANDAMAKVLFTGNIEADGDLEIPVTLLETATTDAGPSGGLNHFIAVEHASTGELSGTSNTLVVELDPTVVVDGTLNGTLALQGRTDNTSTVEVALYDTSGVQVGTTESVSVDASGQFTVTGITPDTYQVAVKHPQYLQIVDSIAIASGDNSFDFGEALAGDANDDNIISLSDFSILSSAFNTSSDLRADFNNDGVVSLADFSLLSTNFNTAGEVPAP